MDVTIIDKIIRGFHDNSIDWLLAVVYIFSGSEFIDVSVRPKSLLTSLMIDVLSFGVNEF
jgi:hypothetical protein